MPVLERTRDLTERRPVLSLAAFCAVSLGLGIALGGASGVLWAIGAICRVAFFVAALALVVVAFRKMPGRAWLGLVVLVLAGGAVIGIIQSEPTSKSEKAHIRKLEPKAGQYAAASGKASSAKARISGRVVTIDLGNRKIDEAVYVRLPNDRQARTPKEVSTVVQIRYEKAVVGHYKSGGKAIQESAIVTVVDLRAHRKYRSETIDGPEPPFVKRGGGDAFGGAVDPADIANYLKALPRRSAT